MSDQPQYVRNFVVGDNGSEMLDWLEANLSDEYSITDKPMTEIVLTEIVLREIIFSSYESTVYFDLKFSNWYITGDATFYNTDIDEDFILPPIMEIHGILDFLGCQRLLSLPEDLSVSEILDLEGCDNLKKLPQRLYVGGHMDIRLCPHLQHITEYPGVKTIFNNTGKYTNGVLEFKY